MTPLYLLKIVTVGAPAVGKTSMIVRYSTGTFREHYSPTLGTSFAYKELDFGDSHVDLQIWDLGSQDFLERVRSHYYKGATGVIYMFDVTRPETLAQVHDWKDEVERNLTEYECLLIANKVDLVIERMVSEEDGRKVAKDIGAEYLEVSVRMNQNVQESFEAISKQIVKRFFDQDMKSPAK
jgi:small GTP-binding protein